MPTMALAAVEKDSTWLGHTVTHHQRTAIPKDTTTTARSVTVDLPDVEKDDIPEGRHPAPDRVLDLVEDDQDLTREDEVDQRDTQKITKEIRKQAESQFHRKNQRKRFIGKNEQQGQSVKENLRIDSHFKY